MSVICMKFPRSKKGRKRKEYEENDERVMKPRRMTKDPGTCLFTRLSRHLAPELLGTLVARRCSGRLVSLAAWCKISRERTCSMLEALWSLDHTLPGDTNPCEESSPWLAAHNSHAQKSVASQFNLIALGLFQRLGNCDAGIHWVLH